MKILLPLLLIISIYLLITKSSLTKSTLEDSIIDDQLNYKNQADDTLFVNLVKSITDPDTQIIIKNYGCFKDLDERFFVKKFNPFDSTKISSSAFVISNTSDTTFSFDFERLFDKITTNGFGKYIISLKKKYSIDNYKNISVPELGILAIFSGYMYISICKESLDGLPLIYFTYSPPMNKYNLNGQFSPKELELYTTKPDFPMKSLNTSSQEGCGFPCSNDSNYNCGSINYPNIKSPVTFAVYNAVISIT